MQHMQEHLGTYFQHMAEIGTLQVVVFGIVDNYACVFIGGGRLLGMNTHEMLGSTSKEQTGKQRLSELLIDFNSSGTVGEMKSRLLSFYEGDRKAMIKDEGFSTILQDKYKKTGGSGSSPMASELKKSADYYQASALEMDEIKMLLNLYAGDDNESFSDFKERLAQEAKS